VLGGLELGRNQEEKLHLTAWWQGTELGGKTPSGASDRLAAKKGTREKTTIRMRGGHKRDQ
jgi:hypothetical protein